MASSSSAIDKNLSGFESVSTSSVNSDVPILFDLEATCSPNQQLCFMQELAMVCERYEASERAGAAVASATLQSFGIVTKEDKHYVVNRSKLQRESKIKKEKMQQ